METYFESRKKSEALQLTFKSTSVRKQNPLRGIEEASIKQRKRFRELCTNARVNGSVNYPGAAAEPISDGCWDETAAQQKRVAVTIHIKKKKKMSSTSVAVPLARS